MTEPFSKGLLDTSVFIALESGRRIEGSRLPAEGVLSAVTIAELQAGVLAASELGVRSRRLATLETVADIEVLDIDARVAREWARLRVHLSEGGRRINVNDLWIAATAVAHGLPVVTQDDDFAPLEGAGGVTIIRV